MACLPARTQDLSLACVDYEAQFALPLGDARRRIGIASAQEIHARGFPSKGGWLDHIERNLTGGKPAQAAR